MTEAQYQALGGHEEVVTNKGKVMIQCLDRSGSMSGAPFNALKTAVLEMGKTILSKDKNERPFEDYITLLYDHHLETRTFENATQYESFIKDTRIGGSTDFKIVFENIMQLVRDRLESKN